MGVIVTDDAATINDRRQFMIFVGVLTFPFGDGVTPDPEPGYATVRIDIEAEVVVCAIVRDGEQVGRIRGDVGFR